MNLSGQAVRDALRFHRLDLSNLLVIYDDLNLDLGRIRIRPDGSHGGQNGLKSIIQELGTDQFPRIRVGVGHPGDAGQFRDHVLGRWEREEIPVIREQIVRAAEATLCILREGLEPAMNRYNAKQ
jgi:PTH1 family peptidyl-tRNA hydrolase